MSTNHAPVRLHVVSTARVIPRPRVSAEAPPEPAVEPSGPASRTHRVTVASRLSTFLVLARAALCLFSGGGGTALVIILGHQEAR